MSPVKSFSKITTDETLLQNAQHGSRAFPFQYYYEDIWAFEFHCIDWHWHPELELVYVQSGQAVCYIGDETIELGPGSGLLINARVIHRFEARETTKIPNAVFSPLLLAPEESLVYQKYILPFLSGGQAFQLFDPAIPWQAACIHQILELFALQDSTQTAELRTVARLMDFWSDLFPHLRSDTGGAPDAARRADQTRVQMMLQFIQSHYQENIRLEDIAQAVFIGKSTSLRLFQQYIHTSPVAYLIQYRLKKAAEQLSSTEKKISAIADKTGFRSDGYFCRKFKEFYGISPQAYRKHTLTKRRITNYF